jgi:hypothetical protein
MGPACKTRRAGRSRSGLLVSGTVVLRLDGACVPKCRLRSTVRGLLPLVPRSAGPVFCCGLAFPTGNVPLLQVSSLTIFPDRRAPSGPGPPARARHDASCLCGCCRGGSCGASPRVTVLSPHLRANLAAAQDRHGASMAHGAPAVALPFSFAPGWATMAVDK